jgi:excisionase family DNA binding protein
MNTQHLSIKELAAYIGVSTDSIRRAVRKGELPFVWPSSSTKLFQISFACVTSCCLNHDPP